jgi:Spy/CpxP family protein refolding chaperone
MKIFPRRSWPALLLAGVMTLGWSWAVAAEEQAPQNEPPYWGMRGGMGPGMMGYGRDYGTGPGMMGYGRGYGMGPGMMGYGRGYGMGPGMMGYGGGYGMGPGMMGYGGGYGMGPGMMGYGWHGYGMGPGMMGYGWHGYGMGPRMMGYGWHGHGMHHYGMRGLWTLDLSAEQRDKVAEIYHEHWQQRWKLMPKMMEQRTKLWEQFESGAPDRKAVDAAYEELSKLKKQMLDQRVEMMTKLDGVLTKEQRQQLQQQRQYRRGGARGMMGPGGGPWWMHR